MTPKFFMSPLTGKVIGDRRLAIWFTPTSWIAVLPLRLEYKRKIYIKKIFNIKRKNALN